MRTSGLLFLVVGSLAFFTGQQAQAATLRCGSQLISDGDRTFEVQQKCGEPVSREVIGYERSVNRREEVQIEEWVYGPNNGMYQYLKFIGGRLTQIDSKRGG